MEDRHWSLLDRTRPADPDPERHAADLVAALSGSTAPEVVAFADGFAEAIDELYHWDVWGAAHLALGGCGDDAFADLRAWLVAAGRPTWERARDDPEGLFLDLLDGAEDPSDRWAELGFDRAEVLGYVTVEAHERLTGETLPAQAPRADEPVGEPWEEDDLPGRFPQLAAALPQGWWGEEDGLEDDETRSLRTLVDAGLEAFSTGDHVRAVELLGPLVDDGASWALTTDVADPIDVAYVVGIGRLQVGDPEGAARALHLVADAATAPHVRRALAQVELALGRVDEAEGHLDHGVEAGLLDQVLAAVASLRRGDREAARRRVDRVLAAGVPDDSHPWDVAGVLAQAGFVLVELGDGEAVAGLADAVRHLIDDGPDTLPLRAHYALLAAGAVRLAGLPPERAVAALEWAEPLLGDGTAERGMAERERARLATAAGDPTSAARRYAAAIAAFDAAGERWEAAATRAESP